MAKSCSILRTLASRSSIAHRLLGWPQLVPCPHDSCLPDTKGLSQPPSASLLNGGYRLHVFSAACPVQLPSEGLLHRPLTTHSRKSDFQADILRKCAFSPAARP